MKIGFSEIKITPDLEARARPLQLAGYVPREPCSGMHDDLYARAIYLEGDEKDETSHILLIVCDVLGIDGSFGNIIKRRISKSIPIIPNQILISATHTHHGPDYKGIFTPGGLFGFIKGFLFPRPEMKELLILGKKLIKLAKEACENRTEARIGGIQTTIREEDRIVINRRDPFNYEMAIYPLTIMKVVSNDLKDKERLLGAVINYSCHGTVLPRENTLITADYVGSIINVLQEQSLGENIHFMYFNGPCGEINPLTSELKRKMKVKGKSGLQDSDIYDQKGTWEDVERIGGIIANNALMALESIRCQNQGKFQVLVEKVKIPVKDYNYGADFRSAYRRLKYRFKRLFFTTLIKMGILKSNIFMNVENTQMKNYVETSLQVIIFGEFLIIAVPGEYFLELGNELLHYSNHLFPTKKTFIVELANDSIGYLYTIQAYLEGGYESSFSITPLGGRFLTVKIKQMLKKLKNND